MTPLLDQAFQAAQKLPSNLKDELAQQLDDIQNELRWQETLSASDVESAILARMALAALAEDDATENSPLPLPGGESRSVFAG